MSDRGPLEVEFTLVLYGVVVANAIYELTFGIEFRNAMLLFAFAIILGDWVEYRIEIREVTSTPTNYALAFVMDMTILITWYFLTILPPGELVWFFAVAGTFFFLQALWNRLMLRNDLRTLLGGAQLQLSVGFFVFAATFELGLVSRELALGLAIVAFLGRKAPVWRQLLSNSPNVL